MLIGFGYLPKQVQVVIIEFNRRKAQADLLGTACKIFIVFHSARQTYS